MKTRLCAKWQVAPLLKTCSQEIHIIFICGCAQTVFVEFILTKHLKVSCSGYYIGMHHAATPFPKSSICSLKYAIYTIALLVNK